jgi:hypothetical protein
MTHRSIGRGKIGQTVARLRGPVRGRTKEISRRDAKAQRRREEEKKRRREEEEKRE